MYHHGLYCGVLKLWGVFILLLKLLPTGTQTHNANQVIGIESSIRPELDKKCRSFISPIFDFSHEHTSSRQKKNSEKQHSKFIFSGMHKHIYELYLPCIYKLE